LAGVHGGGVAEGDLLGDILAGQGDPVAEQLAVRALPD
jgi:hypothetical protein